MKLLAELRRRNVFRVAAAYLIVAWLLVQLADILLGNFGAPSWVFQSFVTVLVLGFPLALFLAWALELTPDGVRRANAVQGESIAAPGRKPIDWLILAGLVVVIGLLVAERFQASVPVEPTDGAGVMLVVDGNGERKRLEPSIAVLPFASLSADPEDAFFAIGVQEDVLTFLSRLAGIRVISRTSVEQFAGARPPIGEIATMLDVTHVLEGSVRRAGERVRVTVQLIETESDRHLWAEHYDRDLADVFAIQTEIAQAVAGQLKRQLEPEQERQLVAPGTRPEVYELYLRARANRWRLTGIDNTRARVAELERIIELDSDYAPLWFELLEACALLVFNSYLLEPHCRAQVAQAMVELRRLGFDPLDLQLAEGIRSYYVERDLAGALEQFDAIARARPNDIDALRYQALVARRLGEWDRTIEIMETVMALDPLNPQAWATIGIAHRDAGRWEEAIDRFARAVRQFPEIEEFAFSHAEYIYRHSGDRTRLRALLPGLSARMRASAATVALNDGLFDSTEDALDWLAGAASDDVYLATRIEWTVGVRLLVDGNIDAGIKLLHPITLRAQQFVAGFENDFQPEMRNLLAQIAMTAALVGDVELARRFEERALTRLAALHGESEAEGASSALLLTEALLGEPATVWPQVEARIRQPGTTVTEWSLADDLLTRHVFGQTDGYRRFLADLGRDATDGL
jgi:TolB-like protein